MKILQREQMKVGDVIGVPKSVRVGWSGRFRYNIIEEETIKKISPKLNNITTNVKTYDKNYVFYEIDEEAKHQTKIAREFARIQSKQMELENIFRKTDIKDLSDETILKVGKNLSELLEIVKTDITEKSE